MNGIMVNPFSESVNSFQKGGFSMHQPNNCKPTMGFSLEFQATYPETYQKPIGL